MITRFFLYFADVDSARKSVERLQARGFVAETGLGWDDPFWVTVASRQLQEGELPTVSDQMQELARSLRGDYGGYDHRQIRG
jgi:hypothetical protein